MYYTIIYTLFNIKFEPIFFLKNILMPIKRQSTVRCNLSIIITIFFANHLWDFYVLPVTKDGNKVYYMSTFNMVMVLYFCSTRTHLQNTDIYRNMVILFILLSLVNDERSFLKKILHVSCAKCIYLCFKHSMQSYF